MKFEIKNPTFSPTQIQPLIDYLESVKQNSFLYSGLQVEIDPTIDYKANDALIRWTDVKEGFNDKLIVNSLEEFQSHFTVANA